MNRRGKLDSITIWSFAHHTHCHIESQKISFAEPNLTGVVLGHMLKVLNARRFTEIVTHLSKAFACCRTSSAGMLLDKP